MQRNLTIARNRVKLKAEDKNMKSLDTCLRSPEFSTGGCTLGSHRCLLQKIWVSRGKIEEAIQFHRPSTLFKVYRLFGLGVFGGHSLMVLDDRVSFHSLFLALHLRPGPFDSVSTCGSWSQVLMHRLPKSLSVAEKLLCNIKPHASKKQTNSIVSHTKTLPWRPCLPTKPVFWQRPWISDAHNCCGTKARMVKDLGSRG